MKKENIPNALTVGRILIIPLFILLLTLWNTVGSHVLAAIIFALASMTDYLDGYLARKWKVVTNFGKFADPMADKILVMAAFIMLVELNLAPAWIVAIIVCRELAVTGLRLLLVERVEQFLQQQYQEKLRHFHRCLQLYFFCFIGVY